VGSRGRQHGRESQKLYDEVWVLETLLAEIGEYSPDDFVKIEEESKPDFKHRDKDLWIEITRIEQAHGVYQSYNMTLEAMRLELTDRLRKAMPDHGHWIITLSPKVPSLPAKGSHTYRRLLNQLESFILGHSPVGKTAVIRSHELPGVISSHFEWVSVEHTKQPEVLPSLCVFPNTVHLDPEYARERIEDVISRKEAKDYRSRIGDAELWLVVRIPYLISEAPEIEHHRFVSAFFSRVYLMYDYHPGPSGKYPVFRIV